jgi:DNA-directed RNA polymerase specialized sigma24 family protein
MEDNSTEHRDEASPFPLTHWSTIFETGSADPAQAKQALEKLCILYRDPIVNWFKRNGGRQDAEDLAHGFIAYILEDNVLSRLTERKGRFRFFLVTCMKRYQYRQWQAASAQKRGGGVALVTLEAEAGGPESEANSDNQLDIDFALTIHERVMRDLAPSPEVAPYLFRKDPSERWEEVAASLGKSAMAVRKEVSRIRRGHWEKFRNEVGQIVAPTERPEETKYLYKVLFRNVPEGPK